MVVSFTSAVSSVRGVTLLLTNLLLVIFECIGVYLGDEFGVTVGELRFGGYVGDILDVVIIK